MFRKLKWFLILVGTIVALIFAYIKTTNKPQIATNNATKTNIISKKPSFKKPKVNIPKFSKPKIYKRNNKSKVHNYKTSLKVPNKFLTKPFKYLGGKRKLVLGRLDNLGRATGSHIQLKESETPKVQRSQWLTVRPSGWHNYKFRYQGRTAWLFNRGHLVGYQFCGLNNEPRNLITETQYMNQGAVTHMDDSNAQAMLFYENRLRSWMKSHYNYSLDYSVVPVYKGTELVPRGVCLTFVGYSTSGKRQRIAMNGSSTKYNGKVGQVYLPNSTPVARINYQTGTAQVIK